MKHLIVGMGEIGNALKEILSERWADVFTKDIKDTPLPPRVDVLHVAIRWTDAFREIVDGYALRTKPSLIVVHSTVPLGTTRSLGDIAVHSPNRGLHPNLARSMRTFIKHVGGTRAVEAAEIFRECGIWTKCYPVPEITEAQHILSNTIYGVNIVLAKELNDFCRAHNLDYHEVVMEYTQTHNAGYRQMGMESKIRPIMYPPQGKIGGHCIVQNVQLIPEKERTPLMERLARFND